MYCLDTIKKLNGEFPEDPSAPIVAPYDMAGAIIAYEQADLSQEDTIDLFQHLVDTGLAWTLQGSYGRFARNFIEVGLVKAREADGSKLTRMHRDFSEARKEPLRKGLCAP